MRVLGTKPRLLCLKFFLLRVDAKSEMAPGPSLERHSFCYFLLQLHYFSSRSFSVSSAFKFIAIKSLILLTWCPFKLDTKFQSALHPHCHWKDLFVLFFLDINSLPTRHHPLIFMYCKHLCVAVYILYCANASSSLFFHLFSLDLHC